MVKKIIALLVSGVLVALLHAIPAWAEGEADAAACSGTASVIAQTNDPRLEYGVDFSNGKPVLKSEIVGTCHHIFAGIGNSTGLSGERGFGRRNVSNGSDLKLGYANSKRTPLGTVEYKVTVGYHSLELAHDNSSLDDYLEVSGEIATPLYFGEYWIVTPYVSPIKYVPIAHNNPLYWVKAGARVHRKGVNGMSFDADLGDIMNVNSITAVPERETRFAKLSVNKELLRGFTLTAGIQYTEHIKEGDQTFQHIAQDGKFMQSNLPGRRQAEGRPFTWFIGTTYAFTF